MDKINHEIEILETKVKAVVVDTLTKKRKNIFFDT